MPVMNASLCIGVKPVVFIPPHRNHLSSNRRNVHTRVSMQLRPLSQIKFLCLQAAGASTKGIGLVSKSKRSVFACNSALSATCSTQTQTVTRKSPTITQAPFQGKEKSQSPMLDDGGNGFPPRDDGGGGGGGGGGENFSGGFFLFGFLLFMGYLKELEGEHENSH